MTAPRTVTRTVGNRKVGPGTVTTARERSSCPADCDAWSECYGANPTQSGRDLFGNVTAAPRDGDLPAAVSRRATRAVRFGVVGDYLRPAPAGAPVAQVIDRDYLESTNAAARIAQGRGLPVWSYTHAWSPNPNRENVEREMFAYPVRASVASWDAAADAIARGWAPAVITDPDDPNLGQVIAGRRVVVCPAQVKEGVTCDRCHLCARESVTVAFLRHGAGSARLRRQRVTAPTIGPDGTVTYG